tara:strand:- start:10259 stop:13018 length:2760 start_codon:yes stop_codon:yes gene_type:complete
MGIKLKVNDVAVLNAAQACRNANASPPWLDTVNQVKLSIGKEADQFQFLVSCKDAWKFESMSDHLFDIEMQRTGTEKGKPKTDDLLFQGYLTISTQEAFRVKGSPVLVTVADARFLLKNVAVNKVFNYQLYKCSTEYTRKDVINFLAQLTPIPGLISNDLPRPGIDEGLYPWNLKYEGVDLMTALNDFAIRTGHCLGYDPFIKQVKFYSANSTSDFQYDYLTATLNRTIHRDFQRTITPGAQVSSLKMNYDHLAGTTSDFIEEQLNNDGSPGTSVVGWATAMRDCDSESIKRIQEEARALANTWSSYSNRIRRPKTLEYFGALEFACGEAVASIAWHIDGPEIFTLVTEDAFPEPITKRQKTNEIVIKFKLLEELDGCGTTTAEFISCNCVGGIPECVEEIQVKDVIGLGKMHKEVPAGWMGFCRPGLDAGVYEIISLAKGCCDTGGEDEPPCPPDQLTWYETDIRCVTTTGASAPGELHQYRRQNNYYFDGWCPQVSQGAWFYEKLIACEINCCSGDPCVHCDCCVLTSIGDNPAVIWKRTTLVQGGFKEYRVCSPDPCNLYYSDEEFCEDLWLGTSTPCPEVLEPNPDYDPAEPVSPTNPEFIPVPQTSYWHIELFCMDSGDDSEPDEWKITATRYCTSGDIPLSTEPPQGIIQGTPCERIINKMCQEDGPISALWTCTGTAADGTEFVCEESVEIGVVECPAQCGDGVLPTECDVFDPLCGAGEECVHCKCCLELEIDGVTRTYKKTTIESGGYVTYKVCTPDPCFWYQTDAEFLPPECADLVNLSDCAPDIGVWSISLACKSGTSSSDPDVLRVTMERFCEPGPGLPAPDAILSGVSIEGCAPASLYLYCDFDVADLVHDCNLPGVDGAVDCQKTIKITNVPCPECGTSETTCDDDFDADCTTGSTGGGVGGGDP